MDGPSPPSSRPDVHGGTETPTTEVDNTSVEGPFPTSLSKRQKGHEPFLGRGRGVHPFPVTSPRYHPFPELKRGPGHWSLKREGNPRPPFTGEEVEDGYRIPSCPVLRPQLPSLGPPDGPTSPRYIVEVRTLQPPSRPRISSPRLLLPTEGARRAGTRDTRTSHGRSAKDGWRLSVGTTGGSDVRQSTRGSWLERPTSVPATAWTSPPRR